MQRFYETTFDEVHEDAFAYLMAPPEKWNNLEDCISFPCTAPANVVLDFQTTTFTGEVTPLTRESDFQVIANTVGAADSFDKCVEKESWNSWLCTNRGNIGVLFFRALDEDEEDRSVAPVYMTNDESGYTNKMNSNMDHTWDGFYAGQKHRSQFQSMMQTDRNYTIEYTSTPFDNMIYEMRSEEGLSKISVKYWTAGVYAVYMDGEKMESTAWDKATGANAELSGYRGCGENRYIGGDNILEFMLTPYCRIEVKPVDAIVSNVRMEWTMDEFYSSGGTTSFIDRVSSALGIHAS